MSHSNASEQMHDPRPRQPRPPAQLVREYLMAAGQRLDALQAGSEADSADVELIWAMRDLRWAVHHLLEVVEGVG